jgi:hypothetical protein
MKIQIKTTQEVEITTPFYGQMYDNVIMVTENHELNKNQVLKAIQDCGIIKTTLDDYTAEQIVSGKYEPITEHEFRKAYESINAELVINYHNLFSKNLLLDGRDEE